MRKVIGLSLVLILLMTACHNHDEQPHVFGTYRLMSIQVEDGTLIPNENIIMVLNEDRSTELSLTVNQCFGHYELPGQNHIRFHEIACTEVCCDSDIARRFVEHLPDVRFYELDDDLMTLTVPLAEHMKLERID